MDCYSRPHSGQSSRRLSSSLLNGRAQPRLSGDDELPKTKKVAVGRLARDHSKNGERIGRAVGRDGCCAKGSGRSAQRRMIEPKDGFECLWVTMRKSEVRFCVGDG